MDPRFSEDFRGANRIENLGHATRVDTEFLIKIIPDNLPRNKENSPMQYDIASQMDRMMSHLRKSIDSSR